MDTFEKERMIREQNQRGNSGFEASISRATGYIGCLFRSIAEQNKRWVHNGDMERGERGVNAERRIRERVG